MGAQVGILSAFQLGQHDHLSAERGGILNAYSRDGAFRTPYRTGALAISCNNDAWVINNVNGVYRLMKETRINTAQVGKFKISWRMSNYDNVTMVETRFYVNGAPVGAAEFTDSMVGQTKTANYDVDLAAGDLLQIWGNCDIDAVIVDQFRIKYDWGLSQFGDGGRANLVTLLPLSSADLLDFTAII